MNKVSIENQLEVYNKADVEIDFEEQGMEKKGSISLINSDCLTALKDIPTQSVDLILTDPPYNLGLFMQNRDTNLKKMRDNFFGAADWDNLDYESWKASLEIFFEHLQFKLNLLLLTYIQRETY